MPKALHVISFNVPSPPDYGGVIDVFYGLKALAAEGVEITLHCFQYGRAADEDLRQFCKKVYYYKRRQSPVKLLSPLPYIVATRQSGQLLENLKKDMAAILFHGAHCCAFINHPDLEHRQKIVRMHNVEWQYYRDLASLESNFFKKKYLEAESKKLKRFELGVIRQYADCTLAISRKDEYYWLKNNFKEVQFVSAFHPFDALEIDAGLGDFALFHGDLSVADNERAAFFLIEEVFKDLDYKLVVAGRQASKVFSKYKGLKNIEIVSDPSHEEMKRLMFQAQMHTLLTYNEAGMKLKLLQALFCGRHILINGKMKGKEQLESIVHICDTAQEWQNKITMLRRKKFAEKDILFRRRNLSNQYDNRSNARVIKQLID